MKGWIRNGTIVVICVIATLAVLETSVRMRFDARIRAELDRRMHDDTTVAIDTAPGNLGPGVTWSVFPDLVYELRPNLRGTYDGSRFANNRLGFRHDHETLLEKPDSTFRVLGVGDDGMLGRGVDNGETYLDHLQAKLGAHSPGRAEVINGAVWGYNAAQAIATIRWKAGSLDPDVVVVGLAGNDRDQPVVRGGVPFPSDGPYLWHAIQQLLAGDNDDIVRTDSSGRSSFASFMAVFDELAHLAREHGFRVVLFSECLPIEGLTAPSHCQLASTEQWRAFDHRNFTHWGFAACPWRWDLVPTRGTFPTADGNRILADMLYDCLMSNRQTRPPILMTDSVEISVGQPSLELHGFQPVDPSASRAAWSEAEAQIVLHWLPAGERFRVSLRLVDVAHLSRVRFGPPDATREVGIDGDLLATYPEAIEVDQSGTLRLDLSLGPSADPSDARVPSIALTSVLLVSQPHP